MSPDVLNQAAIFAQAFLMGALLGLVYDGMRTLRRSLQLPGLAFLLDLLFWLGAAASLFAFTLLRDDGQVRIFHMAAAVLGGLTSPFGAVMGGFLVGIFENLVGTYIPGVGNELKLPIALALIIVVLVVKPAGLFGRAIVKRV